MIIHWTVLMPYVIPFNHRVVVEGLQVSKIITHVQRKIIGEYTKTPVNDN
jgi:hypothetical protein